MKWLTVMKIRGVEYAAKKFNETEIHRCNRQFRPKKATVLKALAIVIMGIAVMGMSTFGALVATHTITNGGSITAVGVGVYSDSGCTKPLSTVSWGTLNPGSVATYTMYVENTGNVPETLNMTVTGWSPSSASSYITLTWNQEQTNLTAGSNVTAVVTLTVSSSITSITSFSFNIIISGIH